MIRAATIKAGDRVAVRAHNRSVTRTVMSVGDSYVVVHVCGEMRKIPEHHVTGHVRV
jgi:hypothetical protein